MAVQGKGDPHVIKNCTAPYDQVCMIETFSTLGNTVSHIRDCSNGKQFSYTANIVNDRGAYARLYALQHNNETACVWDGNNMACLTKCDEDLCNGPQINGCISHSQISFPLIFMYALFVTRLTKHE
ncbi:hypothetical protein DPMN_092063 [Dreissena polymorpha]|uniref:Uncharacterized protein n=1 Tax=Dreissena polymorpha TaxID=45954 RepID=A0A9D4R1A8_DREPO|nr:hypothetical protein DPMN_092063 [Dreissena polymorpha]